MVKKKVRLKHDSDTLTPQHLLKLDPGTAEETFNRLALDRKIQLVLAAPWQKRRAIIMLAENARELVQALPPQEIYLTVLQCGVEDSVQLIALTSHEQFQFLFDIDCWRKDSLDTTSIARWYNILAKCNEQKVIEWFERADEEFLVASLKKILKVSKIQQDTDISEEYEDMPATTLDGIYFFTFLVKESYNSIMPIFNALYQHDRGRFYSLAEGILWDSPAEVEEAACDWKTRRVAEHGFPEFEEALSVYQIMPDREIERLSETVVIEASAQARAEAILPRFGLSGDDMPRFFINVLGLVDDLGAYDMIQRAAITIANKIIVADALEVQSVEDMQRALRKAAGCISIALESLSGGNASAAQAFLIQVHTGTLFRAGVSIIVKVCSDYRATVWRLADRQLRESFFESPLGDTLRGLSMKRPMLYEGLVKPGATQYRAFMALQEVQAAREALATSSVLDSLLFTVWAIDPSWLLSEFIATTTLTESSQLTAEAVFLTVLARYKLTGKTRLEALAETEMQLFIDAAFEQKTGGGHCLKSSLRGDTLSWLASLYSDGVPPALQSYTMSLLQRFEESIAPLASQKTIEKRYIDKLLFKKAP